VASVSLSSSAEATDDLERQKSCLSLVLVIKSVRRVLAKVEPKTLKRPDVGLKLSSFGDYHRRSDALDVFSLAQPHLETEQPSVD